MVRRVLFASVLGIVMAGLLVVAGGSLAAHVVAWLLLTAGAVLLSVGAVVAVRDDRGHGRPVLPGSRR
ncbi:hypothetical protein Ae707Ps1_0421c [Pseudonocardia sp. Ae707_Ps1]|nr:hypothetical protein Ae707Ps1_0421c [Pseudonocardia sp. Ae707_Ps1]